PRMDRRAAARARGATRSRVADRWASAWAPRSVGEDRVRPLAALAIGTCCALFAAVLFGTMPRSRNRAGRAPRRLVARRDRADLWLQQAGVGVGLVAFWAGSAFAGLFAVMVVATLTGSVFVAAVPGGA